MSKKNPICMVEGCPTKVYARGVCEQHYKLMRKLVKSGERSWAEFEDAGMSENVNLSAAYKEDLLDHQISTKLKK